MIYTVHPQIQIRTIRDNGTAEITDKETDGKNFYEEMPILRTRRFVKCWNCHDDLLAACKMLQKDVHARYCDPHPMGQSELCKIAKAAIDKAS